MSTDNNTAVLEHLDRLLVRRRRLRRQLEALDVIVLPHSLRLPHNGDTKKVLGMLAAVDVPKQGIAFGTIESIDDTTVTLRLRRREGLALWPSTSLATFPRACLRPVFGVEEAVVEQPLDPMLQAKFDQALAADRQRRSDIGGGQ